MCYKAISRCRILSQLERASFVGEVLADVYSQPRFSRKKWRKHERLSLGLRTQDNQAHPAAAADREFARSMFSWFKNSRGTPPVSAALTARNRWWQTSDASPKTVGFSANGTISGKQKILFIRNFFFLLNLTKLLDFFTVLSFICLAFVLHTTILKKNRKPSTIFVISLSSERNKEKCFQFVVVDAIIFVPFLFFSQRKRGEIANITVSSPSLKIEGKTAAFLCCFGCFSISFACSAQSVRPRVRL